MLGIVIRTLSPRWDAASRPIAQMVYVGFPWNEVAAALRIHPSLVYLSLHSDRCRTLLLKLGFENFTEKDRNGYALAREIIYKRYAIIFPVDHNHYLYKKEVGGIILYPDKNGDDSTKNRFIKFVKDSVARKGNFSALEDERIAEAETAKSRRKLGD